MNTKVTKKEFDEFKIRFGMEVSKRAFSCEQLVKDTEAKEFILKYVEDNFINNQASNLIQNITYKFANMCIASYATMEEKSNVEYPIVNKYIGRWLVGSYFFEKDGENIKAVYIEMKRSSIII